MDILLDIGSPEKTHTECTCQATDSFIQKYVWEDFCCIFANALGCGWIKLEVLEETQTVPFSNYQCFLPGFDKYNLYNTPPWNYKKELKNPSFQTTDGWCLKAKNRWHNQHPLSWTMSNLFHAEWLLSKGGASNNSCGSSFLPFKCDLFVTMEHDNFSTWICALTNQDAQQIFMKNSPFLIFCQAKAAEAILKSRFKKKRIQTHLLLV